MTCREIQPYLDDYLTGRLDGNFRTLIDEHLEGCRNCRDELEQLKILTDILKADKVPDPGEKYWDNLEKNIFFSTTDTSETAVTEKTSKPVFTFLKYAVSLAAGVLIFAITLITSGPMKSPVFMTEINDYKTAPILADLDELSIAGGKSKSALMSSILLAPPGSFGQQGIIFGRIGHITDGEDTDDSRNN